MTSELTPYQANAVQRFVNALPSNATTVLEIGSDLEANVVRNLASRTQCEVIGINPAPTFPQLSDGEELANSIRLLKVDGREIPLPDNSVDGVFTVATIEHVLGVDRLYAEILRVLKPGGVLFADFAPIWSSYNGHHTYAVVDGKEARYWKPGRNPVPDFSHLLWSPDEMRDFLHHGPCDDSLVEPIIEWIYHGDGVNRLFLEDHLRALHSSGLACERLKLKPGIAPDPQTESKLRSRYGDKTRFDVAGVEATMRKPENAGAAYLIASRRIMNGGMGAVIDFARSFSPVIRRSRTARRLLNRRHLR